MNTPSNEPGGPARAAAREARRSMHRRRFGTPGTEPPAGRNPVRHWGSIGVAIVATIVSFSKVTEVGAALAVVSFALGVPRSWTWANDRLASLSWAAGAAMLIAGEILYIVGDSAIRQTPGGGRSAGAAPILIGVSTLVAIPGYYRRWGRTGNTAYWDRQMRKGDPDALAAIRSKEQASGRSLGDREDG